MSAPREIIDLIDRFARNAASYRAADYGETEVRVEFINPFFNCLGWDINNALGFAEAYKDVIHEDAIKVGGVTKAPDYCFRVGGTRKFFLEAKRPSINLKSDPVPAFQLRRYAFSAQLPLSILTDFEEFAVYDCRVKPALTDKASVGRVRYLNFTDYAEQWDSIAATFSKDAVYKGSFDKYAETTKLKRGTATLEPAFLKEIEGWRELLAKNIALRNNLSQRELNFAVQVTIDRILFLRMCEDRGIELYGQLGALQNGTAVYGRLKELFRKADQRYNSGLFHFDKEHNRPEQPDELTPTLAIDDKPLKEIFKHLYYPDSPYEFSVLPVEILGQVYEQFLGKVIRLTSSHRAVVEEKPEVRKAGGVYYTPTYIVDYIVRNTVGKLLEGKTPKQVSKLKVLDPACGSGSFLLGAYQFLLDWHRDRYLEQGTAKHPKELFQGRGGAWRLTSAEKKRILINNIFGVDIDPQAVEVTKLSLLLKVLEGESQQSLEHQLLLFHERALPDLGSNIKCGNSLIGPDFYDGQQATLFDEEERYRINVFDWNAEFPAIMKAGGFDAVIGNPPYGAFFSEAEAAHLRKEYSSPANSLDSFIIFVEKASSLLRPLGFLGFIIPSGWVSSPSSKPLRRMFLDLYVPQSFVSLPFDVFPGAYIDTIIMTASKLGKAKRPDSDRVDLVVFPFRFKINHVDDFERFRKVGAYLPWTRMKHLEMLVTCNETEARLLEKIQGQQNQLESFVDVKRGIEVFKPSSAQTHLKNPKRAFTGVLQRYHLAHGTEEYISYDTGIRKSKPIEYFSGDRVLLRQVLSRKLRLQAVMTSDEFLTNQSVQSLIQKKNSSEPYLLAFLLGVLNSKLLSWYFKNINSVARRDDFPKIVIQQTREMPICALNGLGHANSKCGQVAGLALQMLTLRSRLLAAKTPHQKKNLETQIAATDHQIDALVYELYGLTPEEIKIVEQAGSESAATEPDAGETSSDGNGESKDYTPYQPALDAGIPEEWDRKNARRLDLIERKSRGQLSPAEEAELKELQDAVIAYFHGKLGPPSIDEQLERLERKYNIATEL